MTAPGGRPPWLTVAAPGGEEQERVDRVLSDLGLASVCRSAACPNQGECGRRGTATVLLLGPSCTRRCTFCAVEKGLPSPPDPTEPWRVAGAAAALGWRHVVVTAVTRDDLPDGGAAHLATTVAALRDGAPGASTELLVPDFGGARPPLDAVLAARPRVVAHNVETVPRLYWKVRPGASWDRSLSLLSRCAAAAAAEGEGRGAAVKTGLMLGLGETREEVSAALRELRAAGVGSVTVGQYLSPSPRHLAVARYATPEEFDEIGDEARSLGFRHVASAPLARSSFRAGEALP